MPNDNQALDPRSVLFCLPSKGGVVDIDFNMSWTETVKQLIANGIGHGVQVVRGDTFIDKARNRLATAFLEQFPHAANLFFLDDDIGWPADKVLEFLYRPEPVVAGAYPMKTDAGTFYPVELASENGHIIERNGLYLAHWVATGFMRIKREVLERLAQDAEVYPEPTDHFGDVQMNYSLFEAGAMQPPPEREAQTWTSARGTEHRVIDWRGEDVYFCDRWRSLGGEIWVDPSIEFSHRGGKKWSGSFAVDCADKIANHAPPATKAIDIFEAAK